MTVWENTCVDWRMALHGALSQSIVPPAPLSLTHTHTHLALSLSLSHTHTHTQHTRTITFSQSLVPPPNLGFRVQGLGLGETPSHAIVPSKPKLPYHDRGLQIPFQTLGVLVCSRVDATPSAWAAQAQLLLGAGLEGERDGGLVADLHEPVGRGVR